MSPHSSVPAWKVPWAEKLGRLHTVHEASKNCMWLSTRSIGLDSRGEAGFRNGWTQAFISSPLLLLAQSLLIWLQPQAKFLHTVASRNSSLGNFSWTKFWVKDSKCPDTFRWSPSIDPYWPTGVTSWTEVKSVTCKMQCPGLHHRHLPPTLEPEGRVVPCCLNNQSTYIFLISCIFVLFCFWSRCEKGLSSVEVSDEEIQVRFLSLIKSAYLYCKQGN